MEPIRFGYERANRSKKFDDGVVEDHPHGFVLKMWGEENVVTGVVVPMQSGVTDVVLVYSRVDSPCRVYTETEQTGGRGESPGESQQRFERFLTHVARKAAELIAGDYTTPESRVTVENAVLQHLLRVYS